MEQNYPFKDTRYPQAKTATQTACKIGLLCPSDGFIDPYRRWLKQFGKVILVSEDDVRDDLDLLVLPHADNIVDTSSSAFMLDDPTGLIRTYNCLSPVYTQFINFILPIYLESNTPILGVGNAALIIATQFGCKLHPYVPQHANCYHKIVDDRTKKVINVPSDHSQAIMKYGDILTPLAWAVAKNDNTTIVEAFTIKNKKLAGVMWLPHKIENPLESQQFIASSEIFGDPISRGIIKSLLQDR